MAVRESRTVPLELSNLTLNPIRVFRGSARRRPSVLASTTTTSGHLRRTRSSTLPWDSDTRRRRRAFTALSTDPQAQSPRALHRRTRTTVLVTPEVEVLEFDRRLADPSTSRRQLRRTARRGVHEGQVPCRGVQRRTRTRSLPTLRTRRTCSSLCSRDTIEGPARGSLLSAHRRRW